MESRAPKLVLPSRVKAGQMVVRAAHYESQASKSPIRGNIAGNIVDWMNTINFQRQVNRNRESSLAQLKQMGIRINQSRF